MLDILLIFLNLFVVSGVAEYYFLSTFYSIKQNKEQYDKTDIIYNNLSIAWLFYTTQQQTVTHFTAK
jgi:hypothetical protein